MHGKRVAGIIQETYEDPWLSASVLSRESFF